MDGVVREWFHLCEDANQDPAALAQAGVRHLQAAPSLPRVVTADMHTRLAALFLLAGDVDSARTHAVEAVRLSLDLTVEGRLHVLPRALGFWDRARGGAVAAPAEEEIVRRGHNELAAAIETSVAGADGLLTRLATLGGIAASLGSMNPDEVIQVRSRLKHDAVRLSAELEAAGEPALALEAQSIAAR